MTTVVDAEGRLLGIITDGDCGVCTCARGFDSRSQGVGDVATPNPKVIGPRN
jgi:hypothetical protein